MHGHHTATAGGCTVLPTMRDGMLTRGTTEDIGTHGITIHSGMAVSTVRHIGADGMTRGTVRGETRGTATIIIGITTMGRAITTRSSMCRHTDTAQLPYTTVREAQAADSQEVRRHRWAEAQGPRPRQEAEPHP